MMKELGYKELPPQQIVAQHGFCSLLQAIHTYHGGYRAFRRIISTHLGNESEASQLEGLLTSYVQG